MIVDVNKVLNAFLVKLSFIGPSLLVKIFLYIIQYMRVSPSLIAETILTHANRILLNLSKSYLLCNIVVNLLNAFHLNVTNYKKQGVGKK